MEVVPAEGYVPFDPDPAKGLLVDRFEQAVVDAPDRAAVITDTATLTMAEFNGQANAIAYRLLEGSIRPGSLVALCMTHGPEKTAAAVGVLKASSAYVSIDPMRMDRELRDFFSHSNPSVILTDKENQTRSVQLANPAAAVIEVSSFLDDPVAENPARTVTADSLINLCYTSGSTATPKAAIRTHRYKLTTISSVIELCKIGPSDRVTLFHGFSNTHLLGPLIAGASIHPFDLRHEGFGAKKAWLRCQRITCYGGMVTGLRQLLAALGPDDFFPDMRAVSVVGEPLYRADLERFDRAFPSECAFMNWYASTEHQVIAAFTADRNKLPIDGDIVPLGYPAPRMDVTVVDDHSRTVPTGTVGEVVVRGTDLNPGYWRDPELSAKVWRPDPSTPGQRVYHTGDLAVMDEAGCLHGRGRVDQQFKIRGHRVVPGEVENMLVEHPAIKAAVVVPDQGESGAGRLIGYIVGETNGIPTTAELRAYLGRRLPDYMVPGVFMPVTDFSLTATGKIDRRALPSPRIDIHARSGGIVAPTNDVEAALTAIWQELLGAEKISVEDDFFLIGGDSLKALTMILKVEERLGRQLPFESLWLQGSTIRALARAIAGEVPPAGWGQALALQSQGEKPALFIATLNSTAGHYCVSLVQRLGADQPVFGLPPKGIGGSELPDLSIEEMADHCIAMMRQVQPEGPYRIMGYSAAGLLAFETARRLQARGVAVSKLVLLDSEPPGAIDLLAGEVLRKPRKAVRVAGSLIGQALGLSAPDGAVARQAMQTGARVRYRPKPYSGGAILVLASERQNNAELARHWRRLIKGDLVVEEVSGDHISMMQEPGIGELARTLMSQLED
jgi:amino acid adenylation domain-containing protein